MTGLANELTAVVELWWRYVFHATWTSSLVAMVLLLIVRLGRRWPAQLRYGLLLLVLIKFAMPPMLELPTGLFSQLGPAVGWQTATAEPVLANTSSLQITQGPQGQPAINWPLLAKAVLMTIHILGCVIISTSIFRQWRKVSRAVRKSRRIRFGPIHARLLELATMLKVRRKVRLMSTSAKLSPMAFGIIKPTIVLPTSAMQNLPAAELDAVLAHELAHHLRGDLWTNWLLAVLGALWWFNPVLWIVNRRFRESCENCCDDLLIARGITTDQTYCSALLKIASTLPDTLQLNAAFGFAATRLHPLAMRVGRIMDPRTKKLTRLPIASMGMIVVLAGLVLPGLPSNKPERADAPQVCKVKIQPAESSIAARETPEKIQAVRYAKFNQPRPIKRWPAEQTNCDANFYHTQSSQDESPAESETTKTLASVPQIAVVNQHHEYQQYQQYQNSQQSSQPQQFGMIYAPAQTPSSSATVRQVSLNSPMMLQQTNAPAIRTWQPRAATLATKSRPIYQQSSHNQFVPKSEPSSQNWLIENSNDSGQEKMMAFSSMPGTSRAPEFFNTKTPEFKFPEEQPKVSAPAQPKANTPETTMGPSPIYSEPTKPTGPKTPPAAAPVETPLPVNPGLLTPLPGLHELLNGSVLDGVFVQGNGLSNVDAPIANTVTSNFADHLIDGIGIDTGSVILDPNNPFTLAEPSPIITDPFAPGVFCTPEPATLSLLAIGTLLLPRRRRRQ